MLMNIEAVIKCLKIVIFNHNLYVDLFQNDSY